MESSLLKAKGYWDRAENMKVLAIGVENDERRRIMLDIAEHYYLLHDKFLELHKSAPGEVIQLKPR